MVLVNICCSGVLISGIGTMYRFLGPLGPDPCKGDVCVPFLVGLFVGDVISLFLFFQMQGKCKPFSGLCFPLCLSIPATFFTSIRSSRSATTPKHRSRLCHFFLGAGVRCLWVSLSLSLSLSLSICLSLVAFVVHADILGHTKREREQTPVTITIVKFWEQSVGQCPGRSVQSCPCSPHFLPQPSKAEARRGSGGSNGIVALFLD